MEVLDRNRVARDEDRDEHVRRTERRIREFDGNVEWNEATGDRRSEPRSPAAYHGTRFVAAAKAFRFERKLGRAFTSGRGFNAGVVGGVIVMLTIRLGMRPVIVMRLTLRRLPGQGLRMARRDSLAKSLRNLAWQQRSGEVGRDGKRREYLTSR